MIQVNARAEDPRAGPASTSQSIGGAWERGAFLVVLASNAPRAVLGDHPCADDPVGGQRRERGAMLAASAVRTNPVWCRDQRSWWIFRHLPWERREPMNLAVPPRVGVLGATNAWRTPIAAAPSLFNATTLRRYRLSASATAAPSHLALPVADCPHKSQGETVLD